MKKHFISVLIGLLSLVGLYTGVTNQPSQDDITPIGIEENVEIEDTRQQDLETKLVEENVDNLINETDAEAKNLANIETETIEEQNKDETRQLETEPLKIDRVVTANSNDELKELYSELSNCDGNTIYTKVIVNGKEYKDSNSQYILNDLINTYGANLSELDNSSNKKETQPKATQPKATQPKVTQPKATQPKATQPKATQPKATEPATTQPEATQAVTQPPTTKAVETTQAPQPSSSNYASEVLRLVNLKRTEAGLSSFTTESKLTQAANKRAVEIVSKFSHDRPDGSQFFTVFAEYGVNPQSGGENIAYGQQSPAAVVKAWWDSPGHRANILNAKFNKLGVGVHEVNGTIYWSQLFTN